ncbi:MAG TPA: DUF1573 domain-containing protein [Gemmataceae bacterium]|jgi:hypothetical protein|nr:DUF1573 domain-containing protein [Gemmataceae bacterium]
MRNAMVAVMALVLGPTAALAQYTVSTSLADWANKMFQGVDRHHDFGSVPRGAQLYFRFPLKNIWTVPLQIMEVRASCGCVTPTVSTQLLERGGTGYLDVTMDAHRFVGPKTVTVYVKVGPQYTNTATIQVSANSRQDVVFNPGQISFGVVPRGQAPTQTIDVEYAGSLDWRVSEVITNGAPLDVKLEELYRRPGQVGYRIRATVQAKAPPGPIKQDLLLRTNDPASKEVPVLVEAVVQAPLAIKPDRVDFGQLKVGDIVPKHVIVSGSKPFKILAIDGLGDGIQADLPAAAAAVQVVNLKYQPAKAGELKRQLHIKTDLDGEAPVTVTVEGTAKSE